MENDIEAGLGSLINLSGKMRMLSHRVAMFALLASQESVAGNLREFDLALQDFCGILDAIRQGSETHGIAREVAQVLAGSQTLTAGAMTPIDHFIKQARQLRRALDLGQCPGAQLTLFSRFVATDLLRALNEVTDNIARTLNFRLGARLNQEDQTKRAVRDAIESIDSVSQKVKLISLNASIEASHAGDKGRGFSVIAAEIRALSE
ncbi:MAG TPA: methyl-accepting chemotaxis protein, partial [Candidatus Acidoferrum sp.]|nr:methyl-accepting chemotaxis protein [Candidatus Acidoferrum sp.]